MALLLAAVSATAANTVRLPGPLCPDSDPLFSSGFQRGEAIPADASNGRGGAFPGNVTRTLNVPGFGSRSYYLHLPPNYTPARAWPLLLALRGQSLPAATAAQQVRADWAGVADRGGFVVIAVAGNSTQGGWGANGDGAEISAALDDAFANYNIERSRAYLWGFSAGAHFAHALALGNADLFAAYGVSAGALTQYACSANGEFPPSCAALLASAQPKIPVDIHLGSADPLVTQYGAGNDPQRLRAAGWRDNQTLYYTPFAGGHTYTRGQLAEIWNHLCPFALGP